MKLFINKPSNPHEPMVPYRLLYVSEAQIFGGAERYLHLLIEGLDRSQFAPVVAHHPNAPARFSDTLKKLDVPTVPLLPVQGKKDIKGFWQQRNFFKSQRLDLIHFNLANPLHGQYSMLAAHGARVPCRIATMHLPPRQITPTLRGRWFEKQTLGKLHTLISVCQSSRNLILEHFDLSPKQVSVIYNGLNPDLFDQHHPKVFLAEPNTQIVGNIGRLTPQKGQDILIEAAAQVKQTCPLVKFVIVGTGPDRDKLDHLVEKLSLTETVVFTGERSDIPSLLSSFDLFVLPSRYESFPVTTLEAMASGLPVIASDVDGASEAVTHNEHGLIVPREDPISLAKAILYLLKNKEQATRMGLAGKKRIRDHFTQQHMVSQTENVYRQACS